MAADRDRVDFVVLGDEFQEGLPDGGAEPPRAPGWWRWAAGFAAVVLIVAVAVNHSRQHSSTPRPNGSVSVSPGPNLGVPVPAVPANPIYGPITLPGGTSPSMLSTDGDVVWAASSQGELSRIDRGHVTTSRRVGSSITALVASQNGGAVFLALQNRGGISIAEFDATTLIPLGSVPFAHPIYSFASYDTLLWVGSRDAVYVYNTEGPTTPRAIPIAAAGSAIMSLTFLASSDSLLGLAEAGSHSRLISLDLTSGIAKIGRLVPGPRPSYAVTGSIASTRVWNLTSTLDGQGSEFVDLIDPTTLKESKELSVLGSGVQLASGGEVWWSVEPARPGVVCRSDTDGSPLASIAFAGASAGVLPGPGSILPTVTGLYLNTPSTLLFEPIPSDCAG